MSDKELIKQEIERRIAEGSSKNYISEGALALESLLDFIDSLPEETASDEEIEALNEVRHLNPGLDSLYWKLKKS
jgi:hypothetical protein